MTRQTHNALESLGITAGIAYVVAALVVLSMVSGCSTFSAMSTKEKAYVIAGVLLTGAITAQELSNGNHRRNCPQNNCGVMVQIHD